MASVLQHDRVALIVVSCRNKRTAVKLLLGATTFTISGEFAIKNFLRYLTRTLFRRDYRRVSIACVRVENYRAAWPERLLLDSKFTPLSSLYISSSEISLAK